MVFPPTRNTGNGSLCSVPFPAARGNAAPLPGQAVFCSFAYSIESGKSNGQSQKPFVLCPYNVRQGEKVSGVSEKFFPAPMAAPRGNPSVSSQTRCHLPLQGRQGRCVGAGITRPLVGHAHTSAGGASPSPMGTGETDRRGEPLPSAAGVTRRCHLPRRGRQCTPEALFCASGDGEWFNLYSRGSRLQ